MRSEEGLRAWQVLRLLPVYQAAWRRRRWPPRGHSQAATLCGASQAIGCRLAASNASSSSSAQSASRQRSVGVVDVDGRQPVASLVEHGCERPPPKVMGQFCPFTPGTVPFAGFGAGVAKAAGPVEQCPSGVEGQCLDARQAHGFSTVAPSVVPCSAASSVLAASSSACSYSTFASSVPSAIAANRSFAVPSRSERLATSCRVEGQADRRSVATGRHSALRTVAFRAVVERARCQAAAGASSMIEMVRQVRPSGPSDPNWANLPDESGTGCLVCYVITSAGRRHVYLRQVRRRREQAMPFTTNKPRLGLTPAATAA